VTYVDALQAHPPLAYQTDRQAARVGARNGHRWCHLYADTEAELHAFATRIGLRRKWAQVSNSGTPHYDLTPGRRAVAVRAGAMEFGRHEVVALFRRLREALP
jgi:hypothetical protein